MDLLKRGCSGSNLCRYTKIVQRACFSILAHGGLVQNEVQYVRSISCLQYSSYLGRTVRLCHSNPSTIDVGTLKKLQSLPPAVIQKLNGLLEDMRQAMESDVGHQLNTLTNYCFLEGGKLLRPTVVLLMAGATHLAAHSTDTSACSCSKKEDILESQYKIALISEMIHTASLVHDDVIDEANQRRGRPTLHQVAGNKLAVLIGDYILAKATQLLTSIGNADVIRLLSQVIEDLVKGEFMQLGSRDSEEERFSHYMAKTFKKTASLFAHSCKAVSVLAACPSSITEAAFEYGRHLGIAFQLIDDALDFVAQASVLGKPAAADLRLGVATAPVLFAARQHPLLTELTLRRFTRPGDVQLAWELVLNSDGVEKTKKLAEMHSQEAMRYAEMFPESDYRTELIKTAVGQTGREK